MKIIKPITQESVAHLFPVVHDLELVVDFANYDMINMLPNAWIILLRKEGFVE